MNVLVVDVGGTHVKLLATGQRARREFESGPTLTPERMVAGVRKLARGWRYDVVSIGFPGPVELPEGCRAGDKENAFLGGFRLWAPGDGAAARDRRRGGRGTSGRRRRFRERE